MLQRLRAIRPSETRAKGFWSPRFTKPQLATGFLPVMVTGGMGDLVVSLGVCSEIARHADTVMLWTNHPDAARFFMKHGDYPGIALREDPFPGFDHWVRLNSLATFQFEKNYNGSLPAPIEKLRLANEEFLSQADWRTVSNSTPWLDNELGRLAFEMKLTRKTLPYRSLGLEPSERKFDASGFENDMEPYVTVHDGYEVSQRVEGRCTKTWSLRHWAELVGQIRFFYPELMIVQLGSLNSRPIPGVDVDLTGRNTLAQSLRILSRSRLHVDGDSGLVHAANAMGVRSIVLFGPTPARYFGYPENVNLGPSRCGNDGAGCWWLTDSWMSACPVGNPGPACLDSITPQRVLGEIEGVLG